MTFLLTNWRILTALALAAVLAGALAYASHEHNAASKAKAAQAAATTQSHVDEASVKAVDRFVEHTTIIREKADAAVDQIQSAPGADTPVPVDVLSAWRSGLRDLSPSPSDQHTPEPSR